MASALHECMLLSLLFYFLLHINNNNNSKIEVDLITLPFIPDSDTILNASNRVMVMFSLQIRLDDDD